MFKFNFTIDKEVCFAYWVQAMTPWIWSHNNDHVKYYKSILDSPTEEERAILLELKTFLQDHQEIQDRGYVWLWKRYRGDKITDEEENKFWERVQKVLKNKFEIIWLKEEPLLKAWQEKLTQYPFEEIEFALQNVASFFSLPIDQNIESAIIEVKLLNQWNTRSSGGYVKREFPLFIMLEVSNVKTEYILKVVGTLTHECTHLLEYKSLNLSKLFYNSHRKMIAPFGLKINLHSTMNGPSWRRLITESIISSIAGGYRMDGYLQKTLSCFQTNIPTIYPKYTGHYLRIQKAALKILPLTTNYLSQNKILDQIYADQVTLVWKDLIWSELTIIEKGQYWLKFLFYCVKKIFKIFIIKK